MKIEHEQEYLRATEAAVYLGITPATLYRWVHRGYLPKGVQIAPRCRVWKRTDLEAFIEQQANKAAEPTDK